MEKLPEENQFLPEEIPKLPEEKNFLQEEKLKLQEEILFLPYKKTKHTYKLAISKEVLAALFTFQISSHSINNEVDQVF